MTSEEAPPERTSESDRSSYDLGELTESRERNDVGDKIYSIVTYLVAAVVGAIVVSDAALVTYTALVSPDLIAVSGESVYSHEQAATIFALYAVTGVLGAVIGLVGTYRAVHSHAVERKVVVAAAVGSLVGLIVLFRIVALLI